MEEQKFLFGLCNNNLSGYFFDTAKYIGMGDEAKYQEWKSLMEERGLSEDEYLQKHEIEHDEVAATEAQIIEKYGSLIEDRKVVRFGIAPLNVTTNGSFDTYARFVEKGIHPDDANDYADRMRAKGALNQVTQIWSV